MESRKNKKSRNGKLSKYTNLSAKLCQFTLNTLQLPTSEKAEKNSYEEGESTGKVKKKAKKAKKERRTKKQRRVI